MPIHKHEISLFNRQPLDWIFDISTLLIIAIGVIIFFLRIPQMFMVVFAAYFVISFLRMMFLTGRFISLKSKEGGFFTRLKWWDPNKGFRLVSSVAFTILWINPSPYEPLIGFGLTMKQIILVIFWLHTLWDFLDLKRYIFVDSLGIVYAGTKGSSTLHWKHVTSIELTGHQIRFRTNIPYKESAIYMIELRKTDDAEWLRQEIIQRADLHNTPFEKITEAQDADSTLET